MFSATIANLLLRLNEWIISTTLKKSFTRSIKRKSTMVSYNRCYRLQPLMTLPGTTVIQGIDIECTHFLKVQKSCMWILKKYINNYIYYIDESVLLGTKPLVDLIRHFIRDPSGVFSVCHLCECHRSMTSGLSLTLYLNSLVYHRNIFGSSSEVFRNLRQS